ncbi:MAG: hypothetical protein ABH879_08595, partial [archaeon]
MVRLLNSILKKGEAKPEAAPEDDVPDELPDLAEDTEDDAQETATEAAAGDGLADGGVDAGNGEPEVKKAPAELPQFDEIDEEDASGQQSAGKQSSEGLKTPAPGKLQEEKALSPAEELTEPVQGAGESPEAGPAAGPAGPVVPAETAEEAIPTGEGPAGKLAEKTPIPDQDNDIEPGEGGEEVKGFFSKILRYVKQDKVNRDRLLSGDLFSRMNNYWELKKNQEKTGHAVAEEKVLEGRLLEGLYDMQRLESGWRTGKDRIEQDLKKLHEVEQQLLLKVQEVNKVRSDLRLFRIVDKEKYFYLHNGTIIRSLHELIDML